MFWFGIKLTIFITSQHPDFFTTLSQFLLISDDMKKIAVVECDENHTNECLHQFNHLSYVRVIVFTDIDISLALIKIIFAYYLCYAINLMPPFKLVDHHKHLKHF